MGTYLWFRKHKKRMQRQDAEATSYTFINDGPDGKEIVSMGPSFECVYERLAPASHFFTFFL